ncbi:MAG: TrbI/VirB10 family protein [Bryobacteraceae bacterium]|nr:TrbI/VirB10 family protein [Bryobacteraceae bacterium]
MTSEPKDPTLTQRGQQANEPIPVERIDSAEEHNQVDPAAQDNVEDAPVETTMEKLAARFRRAPESAREQKSVDRVRGAVILGATAVGCLFLFFGLFTTTTDPSKKERKTQPSLGRPQADAATADSANRSVIPQLNAAQQPNDETGELTEKDLLGTMRNRGTPVPTENVPRPAAPAKRPSGPALSTVDFEDPALAEAYRRQGLTPPRRQTEVTDWNAAIADYQAKQNATTPAPAAGAVPTPNPTEALKKSSFVFVRNDAGVSAASSRAVPALSRPKSTPLLPQGTKMVARLQHAVSSAAKVPVVAVIEYNYERDGQIVIPAGAKAYGSLAQATPQGWVSLKFGSIEFPDGRQESINGSAISMEQGALKGFVNGTNAGKKFLTRTLTGVGTIAAFAVGGRGLGGQVDNSILLRERLSSNIAMGGEQQLAMLAYQQNIVITLPANTRFYLVLNEPGVSVPANDPVLRNPAALPSSDSSTSTPLASMSPQEVQELIAIRNEMREMNRLMKVQNAASASVQEREK